MEFTDEVLQGLSYLAGGNYLSEENYKRIINSGLGLLSGESDVERISNICPEKSDIAKQSYASLLTFTVECIRNDSEDDLRNFLSKLNFKIERVEYYLRTLSCYRDNIVRSLENSNSGWPNIIDANWRLDYIVQSNIQKNIGQPQYYIVLTTERDGKLDYVRFTCDLHQLQEFSTKLKEIVCHIEKISTV